MRKKLVVSRRWPEAVEAKMAEQYDVEFNPEDKPMGPDQLRSALESCDALLTTVTDNVGAEVFTPLAAGDVRAGIIANYGVGYSHIDLDAARQRGIVVTNTPDVLSECTADLALCLMLMVARRAGEGERELRAGEWHGWRPTHLVGSKVSGKTLGIIGFGRIGRETARRASGFGMRIVVHNRSAIDPAVLAGFGAEQVDSIESLLGVADFVSLHCPGGADNTHLIDGKRLALMKKSAFIINTARGEVIDEQALIESLQSRSIAGAGLDVYANEPAINQRFLDCPNVVLLPHLGSATAETRNAMGFRVLANLDQYFVGEQPDDKVV